MTWLNIVLVIYALVNIGGGVGAYLAPKIQSTDSLIYGVSAGVLLIASVIWARTNAKAGYGLATVVTAALVVLFIRRYLVTQKVMPALGLAGLSLIVLICLVLGHFAAQKASS